MKSLEDLSKLFKNKSLLEQALTHRSWINENPGERESNERLEFLGDAVLEFVISHEIFKKLPHKEEGYLSSLRANIVNTYNLSKVAVKMSLGKALYLSRGEEEGGGRENPTILADCVEAVIGAIFLDQELGASCNFILENILFDLEDKIEGPLKDSKSMLQEIVQAEGLSTPRYQVVKESGPDHAKKFVVEVGVNGDALGRGTGKSKSEAEQVAARSALDKLKKNQ